MAHDLDDFDFAVSRPCSICENPLDARMVQSDYALLGKPKGHQNIIIRHTLPLLTCALCDSPEARRLPLPKDDPRQ